MCPVSGSLEYGFHGPRRPEARRPLRNSSLKTWPQAAREVVMDAWWTEAMKLPFSFQNGGTYTGGPFRGVIHTTEVEEIHAVDDELLRAPQPAALHHRDEGRRREGLPALSRSRSPPGPWRTTRGASRRTGAPRSRSRSPGRPRTSPTCRSPWSSSSGTGCGGSRPDRGQIVGLPHLPRPGSLPASTASPDVQQRLGQLRQLVRPPARPRELPLGSRQDRHRPAHPITRPGTPRCEVANWF